MSMIQADIRLLESSRTRDKFVVALREVSDATKMTEHRLIDAFEEDAVEAESRHLVLAEQKKKEMVSRCAREEKNHTDVEMAHMDLADERQAVMDKYIEDVRKRLGLKELAPTPSGSTLVVVSSPRLKKSSGSKGKKENGAAGTPVSSPRMKKSSRIKDAHHDSADSSKKKENGASSTPVSSPRMKKSSRIKDNHRDSAESTPASSPKLKIASSMKSDSGTPVSSPMVKRATILKNGGSNSSSPSSSPRVAHKSLKKK